MVKLLPFKEFIIRTKFDSILIIVHRLTKWGIFISYKEVSTAENLVYTFLRRIAAEHGLP